VERVEETAKAVRAVVRGRVQGVWYRAHTEKRARELGVVGYVRNLPDGSVEIVAEGRPSLVDSLLEWTWEGSPHCNVTAVEVEEQAVVPFTSFDTRY